MKKIIRGRQYDTEKAQRIGSWDNGHSGNDLDYTAETLYRKRPGEYFLEGCGGARSRYAEVDGKRLFEDLVFPDSWRHSFYTFPDGGYIISKDGSVPEKSRLTVPSKSPPIHRAIFAQTV